MSEEEIDVKEILRRIDDLTTVLKIMLDDLAEISRVLKARLEVHAPETPTSAIPAQRLRNIEDIQRVFPQDLLNLLLFEVTEEHIIIKPRQYLGPENFARIASIVREQLRGEYVSHGKESHFRVPRRI
ncbi:MAG: hypothetical protein QW502_02270 [Candidatus Bathyarchaeia archaeon]|nr:hypothetical protein [Candidatus Bathyarchaeota archaeon]